MKANDGDTHAGDLLPFYVNHSLGNATAATLSRHLESCASCRSEYAEWDAIAAAAQASAAASPSAPRGLMDRVWLKIDDDRQPARKGDRMIRARRPFAWLLGAGSLAAALAAIALLLSSGRGSSTLNRFEPAQPAARQTAIEPLSSLTQLSDYGSVSDSGEPRPQPVPNAAAAGALTGMQVLTPAVLPPGVSGPARYNVISGRSTAFTFSIDKARMAAAARGRPLPPVPPDIEGSMLQINVHAAVLALYGEQAGVAPASGAPAVHQGADVDSGALGLPNVPQLVVGQVVTPSVTSTSASPSRIEQYLLDQPGISPELATAIRALGDPSAGAGTVAMTVLPLPIGNMSAAAHSVQVQGVSGLAVADEAGLGSALIWQKDGIVYVVAAPLSETQLLAVANSLG